MLSLLDQLIEAYDLECCNKDSISYISHNIVYVALGTEGLQPCTLFMMKKLHISFRSITIMIIHIHY